MPIRRTGIDPLAYMGVEPSTPAQFVREGRNPTTSDYDGFIIGTVWIVRVTNAVWMLVDKADFIATWIQFTSAVAGVNTLTGNTGGAVPPTGGNINVIGATPYVIAGNPGTSTLTLSDDGSFATTYDADSGSATPVSNILNVIGGTGVTVTGAGNTLTIDASSNNLEIITDLGVPVSPDMSILEVYGDENITTTGIAPNIISVSVSGTTDHAVQVGNATGSLSSLTSGTDGQVLIGATAANPAFATITSSGGTIIFTPGPNSLNLETSETSIQFDADSGSATQAGGIVNVVGGDNITTSAAGNTITVSVSGTTQYYPQMGNAAGSLSDIGVMTTGDLIIGVTGSAPNISRLTAGTNVTIDDTSNPGQITISASGGGGGGTLVTIFTSSGTFTKDADSKIIEYYLWAGGGGGGSGAVATPQSTGGGGGGVSGYTIYRIPSMFVGATETVTIGAGGAGGARQTSPTSAGIAGSEPGLTIFGTTNEVVGGSIVTGLFTPIFGGEGGRVGTGSTLQGGKKGQAFLYYSGVPSIDVYPPFTPNTAFANAGGFGNYSTGSVGRNSSIWGSPSGGGGGGGTSGGGSAGGNGAKLYRPGYSSGVTIVPLYGTPGTGGATGVSGTDGSDALTNSAWLTAGMGGGGGGGHATNPGSGGNGGFPGGGGGGGGGTSNSTSLGSGAGGDGANGYVIIIEHLG